MLDWCVCKIQWLTRFRNLGLTRHVISIYSSKFTIRYVLLDYNVLLNRMSEYCVVTGVGKSSRLT